MFKLKSYLIVCISIFYSLRSKIETATGPVGARRVLPVLVQLTEIHSSSSPEKINGEDFIPARLVPVLCRDQLLSTNNYYRQINRDCHVGRAKLRIWVPIESSRENL